MFTLSAVIHQGKPEQRLVTLLLKFQSRQRAEQVADSYGFTYYTIEG